MQKLDRKPDGEVSWLSRKKEAAGGYVRWEKHMAFHALRPTAELALTRAAQWEFSIKENKVKSLIQVLEIKQENTLLFQHPI